MIGDERRLLALQAAFDQLRNRDTPFGTQLRTQLAESSGLSGAMIEWALDTSLPTSVSVLRDALAKAPDANNATAPRLSVILAGNVFTACIRALGWPLLLGAQVTVKASSHDDVLPRALLHALRDCDPELAQQLHVTTFDRADQSALRQLLMSSDAVSVHGSDATIESVKLACGAALKVIAHGHGVGAMLVTRSALSDATTARTWAQRAALDVAAYDQRGCLSPHVIWVATGAVVPACDFGLALASALADIEASLPRGTLPRDAAAAQTLWRGVKAACGELLEGPTFAVALDPIENGEAIGPGYRNVTVREWDDEAALWSALTPLGDHLKVIGVAGDDAEIARAAASIPPTLRPHVTRGGQMQTPAFDSPTDGEPPWFALR